MLNVAPLLMWIAISQAEPLRLPQLPDYTDTEEKVERLEESIVAIDEYVDRLRLCEAPIGIELGSSKIRDRVKNNTRLLKGRALILGDLVGKFDEALQAQHSVQTAIERYGVWIAEVRQRLRDAGLLDALPDASTSDREELQQELNINTSRLRVLAHLIADELEPRDTDPERAARYRSLGGDYSRIVDRNKVEREYRYHKLETLEEEFGRITAVAKSIDRQLREARGGLGDIDEPDLLPEDDMRVLLHARTLLDKSRGFGGQALIVAENAQHLISVLERLEAHEHEAAKNVFLMTARTGDVKIASRLPEIVGSRPVGPTDADPLDSAERLLGLSK